MTTVHSERAPLTGTRRTERVCAFWCRIPSRANFGDALTPWLIRRLTGVEPTFVRPEDPRPKYFFVGSIASYCGPRSSVWGAGILRRTDAVSPHAELLAVRGPLTRARALACGADCPEVYGDPALLLPDLRPDTAVRRHGIGIIPHFADAARVRAAWRPTADLRLLDIQDSVEEVIDRVTSCEVIASSSLHGLIAAHAYGIPAVWISFGRLPAGDDTKFHDYLLSVGEEPSPPIAVSAGVLDSDLLGCAARVPAPFDRDALWRACPLPRPA